MTSALFSFIKSIKALSGFLMCGFFSAFTGVMRPELGLTAALGAIGLPRAVNWKGRERRKNW